jgi:hypothetical protein
LEIPSVNAGAGKKFRKPGKTIVLPSASPSAHVSGDDEMTVAIGNPDQKEKDK